MNSDFKRFLVQASFLHGEYVLIFNRLAAKMLGRLSVQNCLTGDKYLSHACWQVLLIRISITGNTKRTRYETHTRTSKSATRTPLSAIDIAALKSPERTTDPFRGDSPEGYGFLASGLRPRYGLKLVRQQSLYRLSTIKRSPNSDAEFGKLETFRSLLSFNFTALRRSQRLRAVSFFRPTIDGKERRTLRRGSISKRHIYNLVLFPDCSRKTHAA